MVLTYFDYADIVYHRASQPLLTKIQRLQNRGLRICQGVGGRHPTKETHKAANLPILASRREHHLRVHAYKQTLTVGNLEEPARITRKSDAPLLKTTRVRKAVYARSVGHMAAELWNDLPVDLRLLGMKEIFLKHSHRLMMNSISHIP